MEVCYRRLGPRQLLQVGNHMIPLDRIKTIQLNPPNGGCENSVRIVTDDPDDDFIWAYENADAIKSFLGLNSGEETTHELVGKTIASVESIRVPGPYGFEPATQLTFTDGTKHSFVHPMDEDDDD